MKLLIVTQTVDTTDPVLGFMVVWITALAAAYERIEVICLKEGVHSLPANVRVHSLGKEKGHRLKLTYALRFKELAWRLRHDYDGVFVHMNQEYILIAGILWKFLGKRIYMWRNHYAGSWLTDLAAGFCTKVFCTSKASYTAKYPQTVLMPVGIDISRFTKDAAVSRVPHSLLFLARIAPSKKVEVFIEALRILSEKGITYTASLYGDPLPQDQAYYNGLITQVSELGLSENVVFHAGIPNTQTPAVYQTHEIFVNCSRSGMFDKTLFEAAACGCLVLAASEDFKQIAGPQSFFTDATSLAEHLEEMLALSSDIRAQKQAEFEELATQHSLTKLTAAITREIAIV